MTHLLATFRGEPIAVRSDAVIGASFHPELAATPTYHRAVLLAASRPHPDPR